MKSIQVLWLLLLLAVFVPRDAEAGLMHNANITPGQAYLDYGDEFPYVGWLFGQIDGVDTSFGSGVLIHSNWALTAKHVVDTPGLNGFDFGLGSNLFTDPGENRLGTQVFFDPTGADLALIYFEQAFTTTPIQIYDGPLSVGMDLHFAGFGDRATPATGLLPFDGNRRAGINMIAFVDRLPGLVTTRLASPTLSGFRELGLGGLGGYSGGAGVRIIDDVHYLGATATRGSFSTNYESLTDFTYYSEGSLNWIHNTIAVPEPSSLVLMLSSASLLLFRRRRLWSS